MSGRPRTGLADILSGKDLESVHADVARIERFFRAMQLYSFLSLYPTCLPLSFGAFEAEESSWWVWTLRITVYCIHGPVALLGLFVRFRRRPWSYRVVIVILGAQFVASAVALYGILVLSSPHPTADHGALNMAGYLVVALVVVVNALRCAIGGRLLSLLAKPAGRALFGRLPQQPERA